jgi:hypothetical protein
LTHLFLIYFNSLYLLFEIYLINFEIKHFNFLEA